MSDKQLTNSTDLAIFKPTPHMEKWLDTAVQSESDSIAEIARESGLDRTNWWKWQKEPGFIEWFNAEWNKRLRSHAFRLDVIGMNRAKRGDYNFWKDMMKRAGNDTEQFSEEATFIWKKR